MKYNKSLLGGRKENEKSFSAKCMENGQHMVLMNSAGIWYCKMCGAALVLHHVPYSAPTV